MSVNIKENGQLVKTAGLNSQTVIIDNLTTQDSTKALSANQGYVLNQNKVDKVNGKGLSTNDYTNEDKAKLAGISAGAEPNVQSDWKQSDSSSDDFIKNKPTSDIKTSNNGQFTTVTGGLMQSCFVDLEPIQSGSGTPSPSNVRAISGHTQVQVGNCGKNKLNVDDVEIGVAWNGLSNSARARLVIPCIPSKTYILSMNGTNGLDGVYYESSESIPPSGVSRVSFPQQITTRSTDKYITLGFNKDNISKTDIEALKLQLEEGSTPTTYEPYNGYTTTINLGGTYYGGTLDAVSGKFTVTHKLVKGNTIVFIDNTIAQGQRFRSQNVIGDAKVGQITSDELLCSIFDTNGAGVNFYTDEGICLYTNGYIYVRTPSATTLTEFNNLIANADICYELATPQTIQLDPQTLETLVGQNDVFAPLDGQSVEEVEYREVMAIDDVPKAIPYECVDPIQVDWFTIFQIHRYGRVVVLKFDDLDATPVVSEDGWAILGRLPERFYHKYPNQMVAENMIFGVINDNSGTLQMKQLIIDQYNGDVKIYFLANEQIKPLGSITYILDHD